MVYGRYTESRTFMTSKTFIEKTHAYRYHAYLSHFMWSNRTCFNNMWNKKITQPTVLKRNSKTVSIECYFLFHVR